MAEMGKCTNPRCGQKHETPGRVGLCFGCHLDKQIPGGYDKKEDYHWDTTWHQVNARQRPPTGVPILDIKAHQAICDVLQISHARLRE